MDERFEDSSNLDQLQKLQEELQTAEQELVKRDALLAAIVENATDAVIARDLTGKVIAWNHAAEEMYGWKQSEILGKSIYRIIPPDKVAEHERWVAAIREGKHVEPIRTERCNRSGERIHVIVSVSPVVARNGEILGASAIDRFDRDHE